MKQFKNDNYQCDKEILKKKVVKNLTLKIKKLLIINLLLLKLKLKIIIWEKADTFYYYLKI